MEIIDLKNYRSLGVKLQFWQEKEVFSFGKMFGGLKNCKCEGSEFTVHTHKQKWFV